MIKHRLIAVDFLMEKTRIIGEQRKEGDPDPLTKLLDEGWRFSDLHRPERLKTDDQLAYILEKEEE